MYLLFYISVFQVAADGHVTAWDCNISSSDLVPVENLYKPGRTSPDKKKDDEEEDDVPLTQEEMKKMEEKTKVSQKGMQMLSIHLFPNRSVVPGCFCLYLSMSLAYTSVFLSYYISIWLPGKTCSVYLSVCKNNLSIDKYFIFVPSQHVVHSRTAEDKSVKMLSYKRRFLVYMDQHLKAKRVCVSAVEYHPAIGTMVVAFTTGDFFLLDMNDKGAVIHSLNISQQVSVFI